MSFVDKDKYLACNDPSNCSDMYLLQPTGAGFRDYNDDMTAGATGKYAYVMSGNSYGDMATAGGYIGVASYINIGSSKIETVENTFYVCGTSNC